MKKIAKLFLSVLLLLLPFSAASAHAEEYIYVIDDAGILTDQEHQYLEEYARSLSEQYEIGVYVVYTETMNGYADDEYARGTYMNYSLGWSEGKSGVLLAVAVEDRYYDTVSYGAAGDVFDTDVLDAIGENILPLFQDDQWADGAESYLLECEAVLSAGDYHYYVKEYPDDDIIDSTHADLTPEERRKQFFQYLGICFLISVAASLVINFVRRSRLNNLGIQRQARSYSIGGLKLTASNDLYLHTTRTVTHISRPDDSGPGGGGGGGSYHSSGFTSSSGGHHF